jgi:hypothetical protein
MAVEEDIWKDDAILNLEERRRIVILPGDAGLVRPTG